MRNTDTGADRVRSLQLEVQGAKLGPLFEQAQVVSVTAEPFHNRRYFLPAIP